MRPGIQKNGSTDAGLPSVAVVIFGCVHFGKVTFGNEEAAASGAYGGSSISSLELSAGTFAYEDVLVNVDSPYREASLG